ncbi:MAG: nucleotidyl transferase AbiEii/AbiGii toxin family protein [Melioribacteraceae bacterium]|nr:nucleotidyl transferase AbiEii/AbiGii toxin family protein [Melioribacteraceae bacterium]
MKIVKDLNLPFYLTGGTALSRFYFNNRYSDDLDFFVNEDPNFKIYVKSFLAYFNNPTADIDYRLNIERISIAENFAQFFLYKGDIELKIDFVNDLAVRFESVVTDKHFGKVDSVRNILSNKISALYRFEIKDYVDIWCIAKNYKFNWRKLINEAKQKEIAVDPLEIFDLFKSFPFENLNAIKWVQTVDYIRIKEDFYAIAEDILDGRDNSLN